MNTGDLETILRSLGWIPVEARSVTFRSWRRATDDRPMPDTIRVPRTHYINPRTARSILRRAGATGLR